MRKEIMKAGTEKWHITYRWTAISMSAYLLPEPVKDSRKWHIFSSAKSKNCQSEFLYLAAWAWVSSQNLCVEILMPSVSVTEGRTFDKLMRLMKSAVSVMGEVSATTQLWRNSDLGFPTWRNVKNLCHLSANQHVLYC